MTHKTIPAGDREVTNISGLLVKQPTRNSNSDILLKNKANEDFANILNMLYFRPVYKILHG